MNIQTQLAFLWPLGKDVSNSLEPYDEIHEEFNEYKLKMWSNLDSDSSDNVLFSHARCDSLHPVGGLPALLG